jgi:hypothetical protein
MIVTAEYSFLHVPCLPYSADKYLQRGHIPFPRTSYVKPFKSSTYMFYIYIEIGMFLVVIYLGFFLYKI